MDLGLEAQREAEAARDGEAEIEGEKKREGSHPKAEEEKEEALNGAGNDRLSPMSNSSALGTGAQLTIFYGGSVCVYDAVPPEKAQAIMFIAAAAAAAAGNKSNTKAPVMVGSNANPNPNPSLSAAAATATATATAAALTRSLSQQSSSSAATSPQHPQLLPNRNSSLCKLQAELPIARRLSLQQFLEKRRNRLVSQAPYTSAKKAEGGMEVHVEGKPQLS